MDVSLILRDDLILHSYKVLSSYIQIFQWKLYRQDDMHTSKPYTGRGRKAMKTVRYKQQLGQKILFQARNLKLFFCIIKDKICIAETDILNFPWLGQTHKHSLYYRLLSRQ